MGLFGRRVIWVEVIVGIKFGSVVMKELFIEVGLDYKGFVDIV